MNKDLKNQEVVEGVLSEISPDLIFGGERYFTRKTLAAALQLSTQTLAGWAVRHKSPRYIKIGRGILYSEKSVMQWIAGLQRG
jgi:predicted DNA-binding transcriptional regulator AlpA